MKRLKASIGGIVQGVSYRYFILTKARDLKLNGKVRNEPDGTVYLEAEGDEAVLRSLVAVCRQGPEYAKVKSIDFEMDDAEGARYKEFYIER